MYPQAELTALARRKEAVRRSIADHREQCVAAAAVAVRPLRWLDTALGLWRQFGPLALVAAVPLGAVAFKGRSSGSSIFRTVLRWAPSVIGAIRALRRAKQK